MEFLPGLREGAEVVDVTSFNSRKRTVLVAKWWMRPVCWLLRKPTRIYV